MKYFTTLFLFFLIIIMLSFVLSLIYTIPSDDFCLKSCKIFDSNTTTAKGYTLDSCACYIENCQKIDNKKVCDDSHVRHFVLDVQE